MQHIVENMRQKIMARLIANTMKKFRTAAFTQVAESAQFTTAHIAYPSTNDCKIFYMNDKNLTEVINNWDGSAVTDYTFNKQLQIFTFESDQKNPFFSDFNADKIEHILQVKLRLDKVHIPETTKYHETNYVEYMLDAITDGMNSKCTIRHTNSLLLDQKHKYGADMSKFVYYNYDQDQVHAVIEVERYGLLKKLPELTKDCIEDGYRKNYNEPFRATLGYLLQSDAPVAFLCSAQAFYPFIQIGDNEFVTFEKRLDLSEPEHVEFLLLSMAFGAVRKSFNKPEIKATYQRVSNDTKSDNGTSQQMVYVFCFHLCALQCILYFSK